MMIRKALFHIKGWLQLIWYKLIYGSMLAIGKGVTARRALNISIEKGASIKIGNHTFFNNYCSINAMSSVEIGDDCLFGEGVRIYDHDHRFRELGVPISRQGFKSVPIKIGDRCWLGSDVVVLKGTVLPNDCVVAAGVVLKGVYPAASIIKNDSICHRN